MRFERLTDTADEMYPKAMELYGVSFPFHEQREGDSQAGIMGHKEYQFNLIYDGDEFAGLMLCWETARFIYVEHFCILPALRNRRYGQRALELLKERGQPIILEIDPPVDQVSVRRKGFYKRLGFRSNGCRHCHPAYHRGYAGHDLVVMSCPEPLSKEEYNEFNRYLKAVVMEGT